MTTTDQLAALLAESKMSPVMVAEQITNYDAPKAVAALQAIAKAERSGNAYDAAKANTAANEWIAANPEDARSIIQRRIDARAASASRPLSEGAQRALRGED